MKSVSPKSEHGFGKFVFSLHGHCQDLASDMSTWNSENYMPWLLNIS